MVMKKHFLFAIPILIFPFLVLPTLVVIFFSTKVDFFGTIVELLFRDNALIIITGLLIYMVALSVSAVYFVVAMFKNWDALSLAKVAMIVKLIQVPTFVANLVAGVILAIGIFTFPFAVMVFVVDCISVFLTGLMTTAAVVSTVRQGHFRFGEVAWVVVLQMVFCADVVASVIFYLKLRNRMKTDIL